ncbi:hypothetical protein ACWIGI_28590 [Nocardia sp. NPDC055321]
MEETESDFKGKRDDWSGATAQPGTPRSTRAGVELLLRSEGIDTDFANSDPETLARALDRIDSLVRQAHLGNDYNFNVDGRLLPGGWAVPHLLFHRSQIAQMLANRQRKREHGEILEAVQAAEGSPDAVEALPGKVEAITKRYDEAAAERETQDSKFFSEMQKVELAERKWAMRRSLLEREPAAVLIGGLLLIVIGGALLVAMFTHTEVPELVASAFLLILGFFFGQSSSGKGDSSE